MVIVTNKIRCNHCGDEIESTSVHDFKFCSCKKVSVDGGKDYLKRSFEKPEDYTELSVIIGTVVFNDDIGDFTKGQVVNIKIDNGNNTVEINGKNYLPLQEWQKMSDYYQEVTL